MGRYYTETLTHHDGDQDYQFEITTEPFGSTRVSFDISDLVTWDCAVATVIYEWIKETGEDIKTLLHILDDTDTMHFEHESFELGERVAMYEAQARSIRDSSRYTYVKALATRALSALDDFREEFKRKRSRPPKPVRLPRPGWVYVVCSDNDVYKIGMTRSLDSRITTLSVESPYEFELVMTIKSADPLALESSLHKKFSDKLIKGEWFNLDQEDLAFMEMLKAEYEQGKAEHGPADH